MNRQRQLPCGNQNAANRTHQAEAAERSKQNTTNRLGKQAAAGIHNQLNHVLYRLEELL